ALEGLFESLSSEDRLFVYTKEAKKAGRGMKTRDGCVAEFAREKNLPLYQPHSLRTEEAQQEFLALKADLAVVASYGLILPQCILDGPRLGCVCIHASLLPKYRGAAPIHRAILNGEKESGITMMQMDSGIDTGAILSRRALAIGAEECVGELHDRLAVLGREMLLELLPALYEGTVRATPQEEGLSSYAEKISAEDQRIDFCQSTERVLNTIRALSPVPCALCRTERDGKILKVYSATKEEGSFSGQCGEILAISPE
ncbi:MAG: methionyl-tRNA formyltransferase, partial [Clostridia bacterium]|nr:methionyl-tRNA formyltransferase [Clostridia bacterium]